MDLVRWMLQHAEADPGRTQFVVYDDPSADGGPATVSTGALAEGALRVAHWLRAEHGLGADGARGDRCLLLFDTSVAFLNGYWGILSAGGVPVPAYPPYRAGRLGQDAERLARGALKVGATLALVDPMFVELVGPALESVGTRVVPLPPSLAGAGGDPTLPARPPTFTLDPGTDGGLVQFTSGSTGDPRAVWLTHSNLLHNIEAIGRGVQLDPDRDVGVSWLPLYHDMGLIGGVLTCARHRLPMHLLPPLAFLAHPIRWLRTLSDVRGTVCAAPNSAFQLVARRARDREVAELDLSPWRLALCGAEPVHAPTLEAFTARFGPAGFRATALFPVYGLAEHTLAATFPPPGRGLRVDVVDAAALERDRLATPAPEGAAGAGVRRVPTVGSPLDGVQIRISGESGEALPERGVGEVWLRSASVMRGYVADPEASGRTLVGGWLRTGDLGYLAGGELHIVGRLKDVIIKGGRNYAPSDLEAAAAAIDGVRPGCVAAFGVDNPERGTEDVVLVAELSPRAEARADEVRAEVREAVREACGCAVDDVTLVAPGRLPKTTSGKVRRAETRRLWETRAFDAEEAQT